MPRFGSRSLRLLLWSWLCLLLCAGVARAKDAASGGPVLTITGLGKPTAVLSGPWRFHAGDDLGWALDATDDAGWQPISVEKPWGAQGHFAMEGFGWYRLHLNIAANPDTPDPLWLYLPVVEDAYEVYWQGRFVGSVGSFTSHGQWSNVPQPHRFALGPAGEGVLAIRVWRAPLVSYDSGLGGGVEEPPSVGSREAVSNLQTRWREARRPGLELAAALSLLYAAVMLASLIGWLHHREQPLLLWVGLFALANVLSNDWWRVAMDFSYQTTSIMASLLWQPLEDIATWFVLLYLLQLRNDERLIRVLRWFLGAELVLCVLDALTGVFWSAGWPQVLDGAVSEAILIPELFPLVAVAFALARRKRLPLSSWMVAVFALSTDLVLELGAFFSQGQRFTHWTFWKHMLYPPVIVGKTFPLPPAQVSAALLLFSLVAAVYRFAQAELVRERAMASELHSAQELQRVLVPATLPALPGYEITSAYRPALDVGGDFFQLLPQADGSAVLVVGDVSGKGMAAAMAVSLIVGSLRTLAERVASPVEILEGLNRSLVGRLSGGFATCVVVHIAANGRLCLASAGHPAPFLNGRELALQAALPLGIMAEAEFEESCTALAVGDHLTLFSDGLIEARSPATGALFGFDRVQAMAAGGARAEDLAEAAILFGQEDDITVVTATRLRLGARPSTSLVTQRVPAASVLR